jgi:GGDEF domain-containing protein
MALFYLLRPREAVVLILVMLSMILPVLLSEHNAFRTISIVITLLLMGAFAYSFAAVSNRQREMLLRLATKDPLTGVGNRRALDTKLSEIVVSRRRNTAPASLILFDLDNFKDVNDTHGHAKGDQILQIITEIVNLRILVEANELANDHSVTVSLGVAELRAGELGSEWLKRADAALYNAKRSGRNATALAY